MITKNDLILKISDRLGVLEYAVRNRGLLQKLDLHKAAEDFFGGLLNLIYNWKLTNLNAVQANHPAIDLGYPEEGLGVQVTSEDTKAKVQATLDMAFKHGLYKDYKHIKVLMLSQKKERYDDITVPEGITFDAVTDILDIRDVLRHLDGFETPELQAVANYLDRELSTLGAAPATSLEKEMVEHDRQKFRESDALMSEADLKLVLDSLYEADAYHVDALRRLERFRQHFQAQGSRFMAEELQSVCDELCAHLRELEDFVLSHFFRWAHGQNEVRYLHPELHVERDGTGLPQQEKRYFELQTELRDWVDEADDRYKEYRRKVQQTLLI